MTTLNVYFGDTPCARLREEQGGDLHFEYLESWIEEQRFPVSTLLPLSRAPIGHERAAPFVASFLPEGGTLRRRLEKLLHVDASYDFGLLAAIGRESAGALSFWPVDETPPEASRYSELSDDEFDRWREYAHESPLHFPGRPLRLSLAGAQSKTALYFDDNDKPWVPESGAATTHIIKPRMHGWRPSSAYIELITMRIAGAVLGQDRVSDTDLWRNCYRVRRFDRTSHAGSVTRLHQEDFCLALGRMPEQKYEANPRERLLSACFELIDSLGASGNIKTPALERGRLLDQIIVNQLLHNADAHLKNYASCMAPTAPWKSRHFMIACLPAISSSDQLNMKAGNATRARRRIHVN